MAFKTINGKKVNINNNSRRSSTSIKKSDGAKRANVVRFFREDDKPEKIIKRNVTLEEAKRITSDPKSEKKGVYFDAFRIIK